MPKAELFDGTTLDFEEGTPDDVIEKVAQQETERLRAETKQTLAADNAPAPAAPAPPAPAVPAAAAPAAPAQPAAPAPEPNFSGAEGGDPSAGIIDSTVPAPQEFKTVMDRAAQPRTPAPGDATWNNPDAMAAMSVSPREQRRREQIADYSRPSGTIKATPNVGLGVASVARKIRGNPDDNSVAGEARKFAADIVSGSAQGWAGISKSTAGLARAAGELTGTDRLARFGTAVAQTAEDFQNMAGNPRGETITQQAMSSVVQNVALLPFGEATLPAMAFQSAGDSYQEAREAGKNPLEAVDRAAWMGMAEAVGEKFSVPLLQKTFAQYVGKVSGKELGHKLADIAVKEQIGEQLTTAMQDAYDKAGIGGLKPDMKLEDYLTDAVNTAKVTLMQSALMSAGAGAGHGAAKAFAQRRQANPYDVAADAGLNLKPPLTTDPPATQLSKTVGVFKDVAAQYGIAPDAISRAVETAKSMPADQVPGFLARFTQALDKRGLAATAVDQHAVDALAHGPIAPEPEPIDFAAETKMAPAGEELANPAEQAAKAAVPADEDLSGLSEPSAIDTAAHEAATSPQNDRPEPTTAQALAGNYAKGHAKIGGLDVSIENPDGSTRSDKNNDPPKWSTKMQAHYGYIRGTVGQDGDQIDTFIKPGTPDAFDGQVFVVDQTDANGKPDEHKVLLGYDNEEEARAAYLAHYPKGWNGLGAISTVPMSGFKAWLKDADTSKPFKDTTPSTTRTASWVIKEKGTGKIIMETFDRKKVDALDTVKYEAVPIQKHLASLNNESAQPDVQPSPGVVAAPNAQGGDQPARGGRTVGRVADDATRDNGKAATESPEPSVRAAEPVGPAGDGATPVARVIGHAGSMPTQATPVELRTNEDGTHTPWHGGREMLDFDSGEPIRLPADVSDEKALAAIKDAGSLGRRTKLFPVKADAGVKRVTGFQTARGSTYKISGTTTTRDKAARDEPGHEGDSGPKDASEQTFYVDAAGRDALGEFQVRNAGGKRKIVVRDGKAAIQYIDGPQAGKIERRTMTDAKAEPAVGLHPVELWKDGTNVHFGNRISKLHTEESLTKSGKETASNEDGKPEVETPRPKTDAEAFADDYKALEGRTVEEQVRVADSGQVATLKHDAAQSMRLLDKRESDLKALLKCIKKAA